MNILFGYQYLLDVINNGVTPLVEGAPVAQRTTHNEEKTKDFKSLHLIHHCDDAYNFEKVGDCTTSKEA